MIKWVPGDLGDRELPLFKWSGLGPELAKELGGFGAMVGAGRWRSGKARWIGFGT